MTDDNDWQTPVLGEDGQVLEQDPPPLTITGLLQNAAKPQPLQGTSLGLLMNDRERADAGIGKDGGVTPVSYSAGPSQEDGKPSAEGVGHAVEGVDMAQAGAHGLGYWTGLAAGASTEAPIMKGLDGLTKVYTYPLTAVEGVAHGFSDAQKGAPAGEAILGNGVRTGLVMGATALGDAIPFAGPVGGAAFNYAANKCLPDGATIGHGLVKQWSDPDVQRAMLSGP